MMNINVDKTYKDKFLIVLLSVFSAIGFGMMFSFSTANVILIMLSILFYFIFQKAFSLKIDKRVVKASVICAVFFAFSLMPSNMETFDSSKTFGFSKLVICFTAFVFIILALLMIIYDKAVSLDVFGEKTATDKKKTLKVFILITLCFMIAWIPYFLYVFPSDLSPDSFNQFMQAFGDYPLSDHHPVVHTLLIQKIVTFGLILSNNDVIFALALYSFCQALFLAMSFSYLVTTLYVYNIKKPLIILSVLFFAIPSYHGFYSVEMWKDIWFAGFITFFSVTLWRMILKLKKDSFRIKSFETIMFVLSSIGVCLFRSNGIYAYAFFLMFFIIYVIKHKKQKLIVVGLVAVVVTVIVKGPVYNMMGVVKPDILESIAIPMQQVSAVVVENKKLTAEEEQLIESIIDLSVVREKYNENLCDPVKFVIRENGGNDYISEHKGEFFRLWSGLGLRYPVTYIRAYINQTYGFYDPDVQYVVYYPISGKFENPFKVKIMPESYYTFMDSYSQIYKSIPILGFLWSIGTMVWLTAFCMGLVYIKRNKAMLLVFLPNVGVWLTLLIATPSYAEFRYIYSLFTTIPLYLACALCNKDSK